VPGDGHRAVRQLTQKRAKVLLGLGGSKGLHLPILDKIHILDKIYCHPMGLANLASAAGHLYLVPLGTST
jgi:hypothetical protein